MANRFQENHSGPKNYDVTKSDSPGSSPLAAFFGPGSGPLGPLEMGGARADDRYPHETFNLPKAYEGKNKYLETQIWWMLNQAEFLVDKLCPWELTDQLSVEWEIWKFNNTMADYEPEQGVPRYVTSEQESHRDALSRRGLAFIIEHGFFKTKRGQETYMMNLRQIVDAIHTTVYYGVLQALLNGKNHYKEWDRKYGDQALQIQDIMRQEVSEWAIAQKTERGLYVLDAHLKHRMRAEGVVPNVWIFPPKMQIFLTMYPSSEVVYNIHGPGNQENIEKGPANMLTFRGSEVHEADPIDVDFIGKSTDLLSRDRMIGNYFTMYDPVPLTGKADQNYNTDQRSVFVYDASADDFRKISIIKAINACMRFDESGALSDEYDNDEIPGLSGSGKGPTDHGDMFTVWCQGEGRWRNAITFGELFHYDQIDKTEWSAMVRSMARRALSTTGSIGLADTAVVVVKTSEILGSCAGTVGKKTDKKSDAAASNRQSKRTKRAEQSGKETAKTPAVTLPCPVDLCEKKDGTSKIEDCSAFLQRLKITRQVLLALARHDVRLPFGFLLLRPFQRYQCSSAILAQGGKDLGITFHGHHDFQLTDDVIHKTHVGHYTFYSKTVIKNPNHYVIAEDVFCTKYCGGENTTFFCKPQQFEEVATGSRPSDRSLLSVIVPHDRYSADGSDRVQNPLDITGRFEPEYTKNLINPDERAHYPGAALLTKTLDLTRVDWGPANEERFNAMYQHLNRVCFQGRQFAYDWKTCTFNVETLESGHWGRSGTYAGCRGAREGRGMLVQPDRESTLL